MTERDRTRLARIRGAVVRGLEVGSMPYLQKSDVLFLLGLAARCDAAEHGPYRPPKHKPPAAAGVDTQGEG